MLMMMVVAGLSAVTSVRRAISDQYYNQLAREASEAGLQVAKGCIAVRGTVTWSDASPLRPNTDCTGGNACTGLDSCYVLKTSAVRTTFSVGLATARADGGYDINVVASVKLLNSSGSIWKSYANTQKSAVSLAVMPQMSGGAGWADSGHIGLFLSSTSQLYGYGDNRVAQLNDASSPSLMSTPQRINLPAGVMYVKKVMSSGQGASYMCIIGSDNQVYCRGQGMYLSPGWNKISGWPANYLVYDMSIDGYGGDNACFLAGTSATTAQVYCVGIDDWGKFGNGVTCANWGVGACANSPYALNNAQLFILPNGTYAAKVNAMDDQVCVITTAADLYCAGLENGGQMTGSTTNTVTSSNGTRYVATPILYNLPNGRKAKDVLIGGYHNSYDVHVLATDGTVWTSGWYGNGDAGNSTTGVFGTGNNTGTSQTPVMFGDPAQSWGTGDQIKLSNQSKCIDNSGWQNVNGNPIVIWDCEMASPRANLGQLWLYNQDPTSPYYHHIINVATGKCIDVPGGNTTAGQLIWLYNCGSGPVQQFTLNGNGSYSVDAAPGLCIDVSAGNTTNGNQMEIWTCNNAWPQAFTPGGNINGWRGIITGNTFFCALRDDIWSGMWCAGQNNYGQFANVGTMIGGSSHGNPCEGSSVIGGAIRNMNAAPGEKVDWSKLTSEWQYQYDSMVFITKSGNVYGAGRNVYGKLGNGITGDTGNDYRTCYTRQFILPTGVTAVSLSTRDEFSTYVLGSDGNVYATGRNDNGQLGIGNTTTSILTPTKVLLPIDQQRLY